MRKKLERFAEIQKFENVFEFPEDKNWYRDYFENDHPLILELACGKGEYSYAMAKMFPDKNVVGADKKGERIWKGAKAALDAGMRNVAFLRCFIEKIDEYFEPEGVEEIWITFPDPHPGKKGVKRRLTGPSFFELYGKVLKPGGIVHLKTDSKLLYEYTKEVIGEKEPVILSGVEVSGSKWKLIEEIEDLYSQEVEDPLLNIKTTFERRHLEEGRKIYYLKIQKTPTPSS